MGTWNTKINGSDTFQDIYQSFFDLYNQGKNPIEISKQIQDDFAQMFNDQDDRNNSLFGLALAQWETKSLDNNIFKQVKGIIETESDLQVWKNLGADERTIEKRKKELSKFLTQISTEREKPKRRVLPKFEYTSNQLLSLPSPDGKKTFEIIESNVNGEYINTSSALSWNNGGGSIFQYQAKDKFATAIWIDSQTLEIHHDKSIKFIKKDEAFYFKGDQGIIKYVEELHVISIMPKLK